MKNIRTYAMIATTCFVMGAPMFASAAIKTSQVSGDTIVISYSVSELSQPAGVARIERAVRKAADKICSTDNYSVTKSLSTMSKSKACFHDAVENALQGMNEIQVSTR